MLIGLVYITAWRLVFLHLRLVIYRLVYLPAHLWSEQQSAPTLETRILIGLGSALYMHDATLNKNVLVTLATQVRSPFHGHSRKHVYNDICPFFHFVAVVIACLRSPEYDKTKHLGERHDLGFNSSTAHKF